MVLYGPQRNSLGLLYSLANKFAVSSQVYSTAGKQVSPPSSPSAALANFLYQPTLCLMQNFSPITYPSKSIRWLLCQCELVTINLGTNFPRKFQKKVFNRHFLYKTRRCGLGVYQASKQSGFDSQRNTAIKNIKRLLSLQLLVININLTFHI